MPGLNTPSASPLPRSPCAGTPPSIAADPLPPMSRIRPRLQPRHVDVDTVPRHRRQFRPAVLHRDRLHRHLVACRTQVDEELRDPEVRNDGGKIHRRRQPDQRAVVVVRRDRHRVRLRHRRDVQHRARCRRSCRCPGSGCRPHAPPGPRRTPPSSRSPRRSRSESAAARRTSATSSMLSHRHGSSYQPMSNSAMRLPMRIACIGASRRCTSTSSVKSGPSASRIART